MPNTSTRLALQEPIGADTVNEIRLAITNLATTLDNSAIWATPTTLALRPAANTYKAGTLHRATDSGVVALTDGTTWHVLAVDNQGPPVGSVQQYAGATDPVDPDGVTRYFICDGRGLSTTTYSALYTAIGYTHGGSAGTLNIPDMRGRTAIGAGTGANNTDGTNVNGPTSTTLSNRVLGKRQGEENHPLTLAELAAHDHGSTGPGTAATGSAGSHSHGGFTAYTGSWPHSHTYTGTGWQFTYAGGGTVSDTVWATFGNQSTSAVDLNHLHGISPDGAHTHTLTPAGSGTQHNSVQPSVVLNYIIRVL